MYKIADLCEIVYKWYLETDYEIQGYAELKDIL